MGNIKSQSFLGVVLTDSVDNMYMAGDTVNGVVYFNSRDNLEVEDLVISLEGEERVITSSNVKNFRIKGKPRITTRQIIKTQAVLAEFGRRQVAAGQYEYPFTFQLPVGLPSTVKEIKNSAIGSAYLSYRVTANMRRQRKTIFMPSSSGIKDQLNVYIRRRPAAIEHVDSTIALIEPQALRVGGCLLRGHVGVGMLVRNPLMFTTDPTLNIDVVSNFWHSATRDTGCHLVESGIRKVHVVIEEIVEMTPSGNPEAIKSRFNRSILNKVLEIRKAGYISEGVDVRGLAVRAHNDFVKNEMRQALVRPGSVPYTDGSTQVDSFSLSLPESVKNLKDSYVGSLFTVRHQVTIIMDRPSQIFTQFEHIILRANVYYQPPFRGAATTPENGHLVARESLDAAHVPPSWHGVVAEVVSIDMSNVEIGGKVIESDSEDAAPLIVAASVPLKNHSASVPQTVHAMACAAVGDLTGAVVLNANAANIVPSAPGAAMMTGSGTGRASMTDEMQVDDLIRRLTTSADDVHTVVEFCSDPHRSRALKAAAPEHMGHIVRNVHNPLEQPVVLLRVADTMNRCGGTFTCAHLAAAVRNANEGTRVSVVKQCGSLCSDLAANFSLVEAELSDLDVEITRSFLFPDASNVAALVQNMPSAPRGMLAPPTYGESTSGTQQRERLQAQA